jgi:uncharacterized protein YaaQ
MTEDEGSQKLVMAVVSANDGERLMHALVRRGLTATRIGSTGGLLRRGNVTILSGVAAGEVDTVIDLIRQTCSARTEMTTVQALPLVGTSVAGGTPREVRAGGAVVFVLDVERFERI